MDFVDEEFLHRKINFYAGLWCATEEIPQDACSYGILSQALWRFDSTEVGD